MRKFIIFILLITLSELINAQEEGNTSYAPPQVILPSPDAYSLGKFGELPVNKYSGSVNIDIPIYTIEIDGLSIPISLSYHPVGMRVEELPSWVGQGWALNAGGLITKTVVGLSDQMAGGGYLKNSFSNLANIVNSSLEYQKNIHTSVKQGVLDLEPDKYYYNIIGNSGSFYIKKQTGEIFTMPKSNLKFTYPNKIDDRDEWEIKDAMGNRYLFGGLGYIETTHLENYGPSGAPQNFTSTLLLKKIITSTAKEIDFFYQDYGNLYEVRNGQVKKFLLGENNQEDICPPFSSKVNTSLGLQSISGKRIFKIKWAGGEIQFKKAMNSRQDIINDYALEYIEVINEENKIIKKLKLVHSYVDSYIGIPSEGSYPTHLIGSKRLFLTELLEGHSVNDNIKHKFFYDLPSSLPYYLSYSQDHWGFYNEASNNNMIPKLGINYGDANRDVNSQSAKIGSLNRIIYPTGGETQFEYESNVALIPVCDYMETLNPNNRNKNEELLSITANSSQLTQFIETPVCLCEDIDTKKYFEFVVNLAPNFNCPGAAKNCTGNLQVLIFKVSGNEVFDLLAYPAINGQVHGNILLDAGATYVLQIDGPFHVTTGVTATVTGRLNPPVFYEMAYGKEIAARYVNAKVGGLRMKRILKKDGLGKVESTSFFYNESNNLTTENRIGLKSSGRIGITPKYHFITDLRCGTGASGVNFQKILEIHSSSTIQSITDDNSRIGYKMVEEYKEDFNQITSDKIRSFSFFTSHDEYWDEFKVTYPSVQLTTNSYMRGLLTNEKLLRYNLATSNYSLVRETVNNYQVNEENSIWIDGLRDVCKDYAIIPGGGIRIPTCQTFFTRYFVTSKWPYLAASAINEYHDGRMLSNVSTYEYNHTYLLNTKQQSINSKGEVNIITKKYPFDFLDNSVLSEMVHQNMVDLPVETSFAIGSGLNVINRKINTFGFSHDYKVIHLKKVENYFKGHGPITEAEFEYDYFSRKISQIKKRDGTLISYFYGYKSEYPVAEVLGKSYSDAVTSSGIQLDVLMHNALNEVSLNDELAKLRNLNGAFVRTINYKPLVGITSETDPNGRTTFYEYDSFNRLMHTKDQHGNIIKKYCYNYAGQQVNCFDVTYTNSIAYTGNFTRNNCSAGFTGSTVAFNVPVGSVTSLISVADANAKAQAKLNAEGQAFANSSGSCTPISSCHFSDCNVQGPQFKCIGGTCYAGYIVYYGFNPYNFNECMWRYEWWDGTYSAFYYHPSNGFSCTVQD